MKLTYTLSKGAPSKLHMSGSIIDPVSSAVFYNLSLLNLTEQIVARA